MNEEFIDQMKSFIERAEKVCEEGRKENERRIKEYDRETNRIRKIRFLQACEGLSEEEEILIKEFYKNCPEGYEVDHIIPLCKNGMHRLSNLQYLTPLENCIKGPKLPNLEKLNIREYTIYYQTLG